MEHIVLVCYMNNMVNQSQIYDGYLGRDRDLIEE
jgi:hypothetical protein